MKYFITVCWGLPEQNITQTGRLHQHNCIFSQFYRLEVLKFNVSAGLVSPEASLHRSLPPPCIFTWPFVCECGWLMSFLLNEASVRLDYSPSLKISFSLNFSKGPISTYSPNRYKGFSIRIGEWGRLQNSIHNILGEKSSNLWTPVILLKDLPFSTSDDIFKIFWKV